MPTPERRPVCGFGTDLYRWRPDDEANFILRPGGLDGLASGFGLGKRKGGLRQ